MNRFVSVLVPLCIIAGGKVQAYEFSVSPTAPVMLEGNIPTSPGSITIHQTMGTLQQTALCEQKGRMGLDSGMLVQRFRWLDSVHQEYASFGYKGGFFTPKEEMSLKQQLKEMITQEYAKKQQIQNAYFQLDTSILSRTQGKLPSIEKEVISFAQHENIQIANTYNSKWLLSSNMMSVGQEVTRSDAPRYTSVHNMHTTRMMQTAKKHNVFTESEHTEMMNNHFLMKGPGVQNHYQNKTTNIGQQIYQGRFSVGTRGNPF